jgi:energy-coupling factor transporter ATP-binding protein EcfA2
MTPAIPVAGLSRRYRGTLALDQVSFDIEPGSITGLLGRNGAGKTTLLRILAGQEFPSAGSVTVLGADPVTAEHLLGRMVFVREDQRYPQYGGRFTVRHTLRAASWFYPNWDVGLASALAADFALPPGGSARRSRRWWPGTKGHRPGPRASPAAAPGAAQPAAGRGARCWRYRGQPARHAHARKDKRMNWSTLIKVARFQLADRTSYITLPWAVLAFDFAVNLAIAANKAGHHAQTQTGALAAIYLFLLIVGALSIFQSLPFALAVSMSRRSYYAGTALLAVALAAIYGLVLLAGGYATVRRVTV